jgi:hypothetical protein
MSDERTRPEDTAGQPYEPPQAEDLETTDGPAVTAAGGTDAPIG